MMDIEKCPHRQTCTQTNMWYEARFVCSQCDMNVYFALTTLLSTLPHRIDLFYDYINLLKQKFTYCLTNCMTTITVLLSTLPYRLDLLYNYINLLKHMFTYGLTKCTTTITVLLSTLPYRLDMLYDYNYHHVTVVRI